VSGIKDLIRRIYDDPDGKQQILFGAYLLHLRELSNYNTNVGASEHLGITERTFQRILNGKTKKPAVVGDLHKVVDFFLTGIDTETEVLDFEAWVALHGDATLNPPDDDLKVETSQLETGATDSAEHVDEEGADDGRHLADKEQTAIPIEQQRSDDPLDGEPAQNSWRSKRRIGWVAGATALAAVIAVLGVQDSLSPDTPPEEIVVDVDPVSEPSPAASQPKGGELQEDGTLLFRNLRLQSQIKWRPPEALFVVAKGKLFLKSLQIAKYNPIISIEYSRFGDTLSPFDPSDAVTDRSLAPTGPFQVNVTYEHGEDKALEEYDLSDQRDKSVQSAIRYFDGSVTSDSIRKSVSCVDDLCAVQRNQAFSALCAHAVTGARLISGFDEHEISRDICESNAPLPLCISEEELGFEVGRGIRVVFEMDLLDGTTRKFDASPRTEGVILSNGDYVSLDNLENSYGGRITHPCE
jgi:hypothetical protein